MAKRIKRKRGAPKGNRNAAKFHYYLKGLDSPEQSEIEGTGTVEGIEAEIALLRREIKKAVSGGDERNLLLMVKATGALEKLIRTRYRISDAEHHGLTEGVVNILKDIFVPLGVNIGSALLAKKISS